MKSKEGIFTEGDEAQLLREYREDVLKRSMYFINPSYALLMGYAFDQGRGYAEAALLKARSDLDGARFELDFAKAATAYERARCDRMEEKLKFAEEFIKHNSGSTLDEWIKNKQEQDEADARIEQALSGESDV